MLEFDLNINTLIIAVFGLVNIPLSIWIFIQNPKSWTNKLFSFLIITLTVYLVVNTELYVFKDYKVRFLLGSFIMGIGAIINLLVFLFLSTFPDPIIRVKKKVIIPIAIVTFLLFISTFFGLIIKGIIVNPDNSVTPETGILMPFFGLHTLVLIVAGFISLIKRRKAAEGIDKSRLNYIFFAFGALFFLVLVFNFILPVIFKNGFFVPFLPIYILMFLVIVSYTIVKHSLFGLSVLATQALTILLWVILFSNVIVVHDSTQRLINIVIFSASLISGILLIRSVITEVKQREKLRELNDKLKELDKQKDEFVSMAAHELRSPLTAIKGYVSMIIEGDTGDIPEKARQFLADAMAVTDRLVRLVNNMLDVSRIEEGRIVYQIEETSLIRAVQEIYYSFRVEAERKNLVIKLDTPNGLEDNVKVDPDRVREVISNFVSNAIKFTEKGRIDIIMSNPKPGFVKVEVVDTGPGISKEEQAKLFQKFYRAESTAGKTFGTGLGLYITKLLIEQFGGTIGLKSEVNKGSNFWFELPLVKRL